MAYARQFGQPQAASPWSAGVPPGLQQQPPPQPAGQPMFNQPMGAFDLSGVWQGQQQQASVPPPQVAAGQWAQQPMQPMQAPVQFVPNSGAYMQHQPMPMHHQQHQQQQQRFNQQQQRSQYHQRSLSAPRIGGQGGQNNKRVGNQNSSFGGGYKNYVNNNNNGNNNNQSQQQRAVRQPARQGNQKVQFSNNNGNNNTNINAANNNNNKQNQKQQPQQQQQQQSKGPVKVTKAAKKQALVNANRGVVKNNNKANNSKDDSTNQSADVVDTQQEPKPQSKTAERKQLKLQARKNAEALAMSSLPVVKSTKAAGEKQADDKDEVPIDGAQLKCVPAVFGFVCKVCDVFLRDRAARREHIDLEEHIQKFKVFEEEQQKLAASSKSETEDVKSEPVDDSVQVKSEQPDAATGEDQKVTPSDDDNVESKVETSWVEKGWHCMYSMQCRD